MKKLLTFLDNHILKIGVSFALAFTLLYPKLPSIYITHTWVYIRMEDFVISALVFLWFIQFVRRKVRFPLALGAPIVAYWLVGAVSVIVSLLFLASSLPTFFPKLAVLEYFRRIEYMILFFVAISSVTSVKDIKVYAKVLFGSLIAVLLYGFGQRWYLVLWHFFPSFFSKFPFCFPSFQTGNEEFAKGIPLCLPFDGRITSTFGGHYDLAGFLVIVLPILVAVLALVKSNKTKIFFWILTIASIAMIIFTASRVAFISYLIGVPLTLVLIKRKKYILPIFLISVAFLVLFSGSTMKRFAQTFRVAFVVTNNQGQVVGLAGDDLKNKVGKNKKVKLSAPPPSQALPEGSSFITIPQDKTEKTDTAIIQAPLSVDEAKKLNYEYGGVELSQVSGNFTVQKALAYDISFTTRFQGEWPNAWANFMRNPAVGSGFATVSLATDNDFLRSLAETGILGLGSFIFIFIVLGILLRKSGASVDDPVAKGFVYGLAGGVVGLAANATLFDIFEASKVAEPLWLLLGIGAGILLVNQKKAVNYWESLWQVLTSHAFLISYLFLGILILLLPSMSNFFAADDFSWLKWAASATPSDLAKYITDSQGFFYRPFDKWYMVGMYSIFAFKPEAYRFINMLLHFMTAFGVYVLALRLWKKRFFAFAASGLFLLLPAHGENIFWISTLSTQFSTLFIIWGLIAYLRFRTKNSIFSYIVSLIFVALSLLSYEMAPIVILLFLTADVLLVKPRVTKNYILSYIPYVVLIAGYFFIRLYAHAAGFSGDYSYNWIKFVPNAIGNFLGYGALFLFGENSLSFYTLLRNSIKQYYVISTIVGLVAVMLLAFYLFIQKKKLLSLEKYPTVQKMLFGLVFAAVALLPFLGLGNISERYLYLASAGFIIFALSILEFLGRILFKKKLALLYGVTVVLSALYLVWAVGQLQIESNQWKQAGFITKNTLGFLKKKYPDITKQDTVYFVNVPIKHDNAWVFPVGLEDAVWFVYRDELPHINTLIGKGNTFVPLSYTGSYVFAFQKDGSIKEVNK